jgi:hypothetical protein
MLLYALGQERIYEDGLDIRPDTIMRLVAWRLKVVQTLIYQQRLHQVLLSLAEACERL